MSVYFLKFKRNSQDFLRKIKEIEKNLSLLKINQKININFKENIRDN